MTTFFQFLLASSAFVPALSSVLPESIASSVIYKDVAIIGGGASGAYAAIRLKEDYGKSIVLVEKEAALVSITERRKNEQQSILTVSNREVMSTPSPTPEPAYPSTLASTSGTTGVRRGPSSTA